jgi:thiamine-phosphate pyrophosphorylase
MYAGGLYFITGQETDTLSFEEMILRVLQAGVKWVQYRGKDLSRRKIYEESIRLMDIIKTFDASLIINDHPDIAIAADAHGVHLGQDDLPVKEARKIMGKNRIVGISTHTVEQARDADRDGADYIGFGPVFHTTTKDAGRPRGVEMLREIKRQVRIPVVAIGGITAENVRPVLEAGADAVAVSSALLRGDIEENAKRFLGIINTFTNGFICKQ